MLMMRDAVLKQGIGDDLPLQAQEAWRPESQVEPALYCSGVNAARTAGRQAGDSD